MKTNQYNEPDVIFLQLHDPTDEGKTELADPKADGVTWCWEQIHHNDVEYIRKDLYDELKNQITAYQLTIENMEAEREAMMQQKPLAKGYKNSMTGTCSDLYWLGDAPEGVTYLYAGPLPAHQIPAEDKS